MIYWVSMMSLASKTEPGCDSRDCYCIMICLYNRTESTCKVASFLGIILRIIGEEKRIARKNNWSYIA